MGIAWWMMIKGVVGHSFCRWLMMIDGDNWWEMVMVMMLYDKDQEFLAILQQNHHYLQGTLLWIHLHCDLLLGISPLNKGPLPLWITIAHCPSWLVVMTMGGDGSRHHHGSPKWLGAVGSLGSSTCTGSRTFGAPLMASPLFDKSAMLTSSAFYSTWNANMWVNLYIERERYLTQFWSTWLAHFAHQPDRPVLVRKDILFWKGFLQKIVLNSSMVVRM